MGNIFLFVLGLPLALIAGALFLTLIVEGPIIYFSGITRNKSYIAAVNVLTNICLNGVILIVFLSSMGKSQIMMEHRIDIWTIFAEAILIPVAETALYFKVSNESNIKIMLVTYLANFLSFIVGLLVVGLCTGKGFHGIGDFFMNVFGGGKYNWSRMLY